MTRVRRAVVSERGVVEAYGDDGRKLTTLTSRDAVLAASDEETVFIVKGGTKARAWERTAARAEWVAQDVRGARKA